MSSGSHRVSPCSLWVDCDAGVDDAQALALALSAVPDGPLACTLGAAVQLKGVSVVRGNVDVPQGLVNVARVLLAYGSGPADSASALAAGTGREGGRGGGGEAIGTGQTPAHAGVPVYAGADRPLSGPPQPLTHYYGRDGLGDAPQLLPTPDEAWAAVGAAGLLQPHFAAGEQPPQQQQQHEQQQQQQHAGSALDDGGCCAGDGHSPVPPGVAALVDAARQEPGRLVLVALGPLTNVALALRLEPRLPQLLRAVVVLGSGEGDLQQGGGGGGNVTPHAEYNYYQDPEAAAEVVHCFGAAYARLPAASTASLPSVPRAGSANSEVGGFEASRRGAQVRGGCPLLVVSWQCCMRHLLPWAVVDRMRAAAEVGSTQAAFFTGIMSRFEAGWRAESPVGMLLGDPLAVAAALGLAAAAAAGGAAEGAAAAAEAVDVVGHNGVEGVQSGVELGGSGAAVEEEEETEAERGATQAQRQGEGAALGALQQHGGIVTEVEEVQCHVELHGERRGCSVYGNVSRGGGSGTCHVSPDAAAAGAGGPLDASIPAAAAAAAGTAAAGTAAPAAPRGPVVLLVRTMDMERVAELVWGAAGGRD